jgi:hypothetical protein
MPSMFYPRYDETALSGSLANWRSMCGDQHCRKCGSLPTGIWDVKNEAPGLCSILSAA